MQARNSPATAITTPSTSASMAGYRWLASWCAIAAGVGAFLYAVAFIIIQRTTPSLGTFLSALFLTLTGLLASPALVAVYERLRRTDAALALWALVLGLVGALGSAIHGSYDLANAINPPSTPSGDLPSQIDPRGFLTFGVAGLALLIVSSLIVRSQRLPVGLGYLGYLSAVLLIVLYLGRLIVLQASSPVILAPALLSGFIVGPTWYVWLGLALRRAGEEATSAGSGAH